MRLYLVQHGKAKPKQEDADRHLSEEGSRETQSMAEFIKPLNLQVEAVWHSGKPRAVQTGEILASAIKTKADLTQHNGLAPNDPVKPVIKYIKQLQGDLLIVGHLPFLSKLAAKLLTGDEETEVVAFRNSGIVCLESDSESESKLAWMVTPDLVGLK
jgi:phosphohistidine phosphatase